MKNDSIIDRFKSKSQTGTYRVVRDSKVFQKKPWEYKKEMRIRQGRNRPITSQSIVVNGTSSGESKAIANDAQLL